MGDSSYIKSLAFYRYLSKMLQLFRKKDVPHKIDSHKILSDN